MKSFVVVASFCVCAVVSSFAQSKLPFKGGEDSGYVWFNPPSEHGLDLSILIARENLDAGTEYEVRVEIHNKGMGAQCVFLPGLTFVPILTPSRIGSNGGVLIAQGRSEAKDDSLNYVVLLGGEFYGFTRKISVREPGEFVVNATYVNSKRGPKTTVPAWQGRLEKTTPPRKVTQSE